jgi:hypothetical protein
MTGLRTTIPDVQAAVRHSSGIITFERVVTY